MAERLPLLIVVMSEESQGNNTEKKHNTDIRLQSLAAFSSCVFPPASELRRAPEA